LTRPHRPAGAYQRTGADLCTHVILTSAMSEQLDAVLGGGDAHRRRAPRPGATTIDRFAAANLRPRRRMQTSRGDHRLDRVLTTSQQLHQVSTRHPGTLRA
jgi:hypothetical protein